MKANTQTSLGQGAAAALVRALNHMHRELTESAGTGERTWLRALAILSAEIEFTLLRCPRTARCWNPRLSALHDHVIAICSAVTALAQDQADAEANAAAYAEEAGP